MNLIFTLLLLGVGGGLLGLLLRGHLLLSRSLHRPAQPPRRRSHYPSITVIRPVRGLDPGCRENTRALLKQAYPGARQTLFVFDSETDAAWPVIDETVRELRESAQGCNAKLLVCGAPPPGRTGKLNAMGVGVEAATGELLAFSDSDTRPPPDLVRLLVEELLNHPDAANTFAPVVTEGDPLTAGDVGYALLVNSWYGASVAHAARPAGELPFVMGELNVWTRYGLEAIGGLQVADGQLVDDMFLGACVARAGLKNLMSPWPLPIVTGALSFSEFLKLFRRWLIFSQSGLPVHFTRRSWLRGIEYGAACVATLTALWLGNVAGALFPAAAAIFFLWSELALQARFSGHHVAVKHFWVAAVLPFIGGVLAASTHLRRSVEWRGRSYDLDRRAKLSRAGDVTPLAPR